MDEEIRKEVALYIENAHEMLNVARFNLDNEVYASAINRAYYAIFYAANALLATKRLSRSKHSGVIGIFRQYFVKTGLVATELSDIYGQVMEDRHESDYELITAISQQDAQIDLTDSHKFVEEVEKWLKQEGWL